MLYNFTEFWFGNDYPDEDLGRKLGQVNQKTFQQDLQISEKLVAWKYHLLADNKI